MGPARTPGSDRVRRSTSSSRGEPAGPIVRSDSHHKTSGRRWRRSFGRMVERWWSRQQLLHHGGRQGARARRHSNAAKHPAGDADTRSRVLLHACSPMSGPARDFDPIDYLPRGVRLTAKGGEASNLPPGVLQEFLDDVAGGSAPRACQPRVRPGSDRRGARGAGGSAAGKLVVTV
jgi:hypothetical protein